MQVNVTKEQFIETVLFVTGFPQTMYTVNSLAPTMISKVLVLLGPSGYIVYNLVSSMT